MENAPPTPSPTLHILPKGAPFEAVRVQNFSKLPDSLGGAGIVTRESAALIFSPLPVVCQ